MKIVSSQIYRRLCVSLASFFRPRRAAHRVTLPALHVEETTEPHRAQARGQRRGASCQPGDARTGAIFVPVPPPAPRRPAKPDVPFSSRTHPSQYEESRKAHIRKLQNDLARVNADSLDNANRFQFNAGAPTKEERLGLNR